MKMKLAGFVPAIGIMILSGFAHAPNPENAALVAGNSTESCLPMMEALAMGGEHELLCLATPSLGLRLRIHGP